MNIKKEPVDDILSSENSCHGHDPLKHEEIYTSYLPDRTTVKIEAFDKNEQCKMEKNEFCMEPINLKQQDETEHVTPFSVCKVEVSYDARPLKVEKFELGESSTVEGALEQIPVAESSTSLLKPEFLPSHSKLPFLIADIQFEDLDIKKELFKVQTIEIVIRLEKITFNHRNFVCNVCMQLFDSLSTLQTHNNDQNNLCFDKNVNTRLHLESDPLKDCFKCDQCNHKSACQSTLKKHKISHTGEKPFACDKCNFKSARRSAFGFEEAHTLA